MKDILKQYHIQPSKLRGQNFLTNKGIVEKIVESANLSEKDTVLEIGPGLGVLTEELVKNAGKVVAVETDKGLYDFLCEKFKDVGNLKLVHADILGIRNQELGIRNFKLVANLPYSITGKIFRKFLSGANTPKMLVVMVQKEVGEKLLGRKKKSMLTLTREFYGNAKKVCNVSAGSFFPKPKVDSMVVLLERGKKIKDEERILRIAKAGFINKRKKMISNLSTGLALDKESLKKIFKELRWSENKRAEELSKDDWLKLAGIIEEL